MRFSTIAPIILALAVLPVSAEVYKWKAESGETQYGQFPPAGVKAERMTSSGLKSVPQAEPADEEETDAESSDTEESPESAVQEQSPEATGEQPDNAGTEKAKDPQLVAQRKQNCAAARGNLAVLQQDGHRRMRLPDGTVVHLTDEEKVQRIDEAKQQIEAYCE